MKISSLIATSVFVSSLVLHPFNDVQNSAPFGMAYADEAQDFELLKASQSGDLSTAKKAIAAGANVNAMSGQGISAIMYAAGKGYTDVVRLLLKAGANPNLAGTTNITPLMCAAMYGRHDVVQMLLAAGAKKDAVDDKGNTAFTYAAKFPAIAQMLAPQKAPQAQPTNASVDVDYNLIASAQAGNLAEVQKAIAAGANVNAMSDNGISSIMYAAGKGHTDVVRLLLKAGANPNLAGTTNITPLMTAAMFGRQDIVQMLLAAGAKKDATDDKGNTAFTYAAKFPAIAQMLAPQTAPQPTEMNPVQLYAKGLDNKDISLIKKAIANGLDVKGALDQDGWTALMFAAQDGLTEAINPLVQAGAMLEAKNNKGNTPLLLATLNGHSEAIKALLQAGANIEATNKSGYTPLMLAAYKGHTEVVKALIQAGANVNEKSKDGHTALAYAKGSNSKNKEEIINLLAPLSLNPVHLYVKGLDNKDISLIKKAIANGLDVKGALDQDGWTALMFAAQDGLTEAINPLIQAGANLEAKNKDGLTPLMIAAANDKFEAVKALCEAGANLEAKNKEGKTPLCLAAFNNNLEAVKALITAGANIHHKIRKFSIIDVVAGATPGEKAKSTKIIFALAKAGAKPTQLGLDSALYGNKTHIDNVVALVLLGAPYNQKYIDTFAYKYPNRAPELLAWMTSVKKGDNPLYAAIASEDKQILKAITLSGIDLNQPICSGGYTPLGLSSLKGATECVKILLQAGADVNKKDRDGHTALDYAETKNRQQIIKLLKQAGAR